MLSRTNELTGAALDWAVAKCEGHEWRCPWVLVNDGYAAWRSYELAWGCWHGSPSTNWAQGGPIIEREHIALRPTFTEGGYRTSESMDAVHAKIELPNGAKVYDHEKSVWEYGPTPLISAMRCYVASKLGDEIEIPNELCAPV